MIPDQDPPRGADEWLITDGRGGYAMGTPQGFNLRRYHGLSVTADPSGRDRVLQLSRLEEKVEIDGTELSLEAALYAPDAVIAEGPQRLMSFEAEPVPTWIWRVGEGRLRRRLLLDRDAPGCTVVWDRLSGGPVRLLVRPLLASRSHHDLVREGDYVPDVRHEGSLVRWRRGAEHPWIRLGHDGEIVDGAQWYYRDNKLPLETERGYDDTEDLHAPVRLAFSLKEGQRATLSCSPESEAAAPRGDAITFPDHEAIETAADLAERAVRDFVIELEDGRPAILAGYPWYGERARDTLLSLPGLLLETGRHAMARELLEFWASLLEDGLLPDEAGSEGRASRSADVPLLFVRAVAALENAVYPPRSTGLVLERAVLEILDRYHAGTVYGIAVDAADGLLRQGEPGRALTWMDAAAEGVPVTPRQGKAIELNALYVEALRFGLHLAVVREDAARARGFRKRLKQSEAALARDFTDPDEGFLRDVIDVRGGTPWIEPLRPNVLFALRLDPSPIPEDVARRTLDRVREELLTPHGLRSLEPTHPRYRPTCAGDQRQQDRAHHQGAAWPWLLGAYVDASLLVRGESDEVIDDLQRELTPLFRRARESGAVAELFDGEAPQNARGVPFHAASVAELARAMRRLGR